MFKFSKIITFLLIGAMLFACTPVNQTENAGMQNEKAMQVTVSILPQKWFVDRIAGDLVKTQTLVGTGDDPHSYEPSPSQMVSLGESAIYFSIGIEFEDAWMDKLKAANEAMRVVDSSEGIERIEMVGAHHHHDESEHDEDEHAHEHDEDEHANEHEEDENEHEHEHDEDEHEHEHAHDHAHDHDGLDPHVWFSARNAKIIANNIAKALIEADPEHKDSYQSHLDKLIEEIENTDSQIRASLKDITRDHFMIVHPAWGYFAHEYDLHMIPVEIHGSEPGPEDLANILHHAETYQISVLFVEKGTNMSLARSVANQAGIKEIIEWDPMAYDWAENMLSLAKDLKEALQ